MARRVEPHDSLDFFPTPAWATRALCEWLGARYPIAHQVVWEPACGLGDMARPLMEYFAEVDLSDVHDYGFGRVEDFLMPIQHQAPDWIITNPPFRLSTEFWERAQDFPTAGLALLCRLALLEGADRYRRIFSKRPPIVLQFVERVTLLRGRLQDPEYGGSATAYAWFVWPPPRRWPSQLGGGRIDWIPPCRKRLERKGDYPVPPRAEEIGATQPMEERIV